MIYLKVINSQDLTKEIAIPTAFAQTFFEYDSSDLSNASRNLNLTYYRNDDLNADGNIISANIHVPGNGRGDEARFSKPLQNFLNSHGLVPGDLIVFVVGTDLVNVKFFCVRSTDPMMSTLRVFLNTDDKKRDNHAHKLISILSDNQKTDEALPLAASEYNVINALRTKPFLLLAGISGTGKSQKVQELAYMTCPIDLRSEDSTTPGNYCLIEVKPNWHDSTELLGYYSALSGKYELTSFVRFCYKAIQNPETPFFVCLDEMNLAPVEQYFAEYLSVLETRKRYIEKDEVVIKTAPLLDRKIFANCELVKQVSKAKPNSYMLDQNVYTREETLYSKDDAAIITYLKANGLHIPDNLFVIGTVNMDDTTHQFSRKVIDRAFTIEMNGGKMEDMFKSESKNALEYRSEPVTLDVFKSSFVKADEVLDDKRYQPYREIISTIIPKLLGNSDGTAEEGSMNGVLNNTPFRVSYRVQNELVLYLSVLIERAGFPEKIDTLISEAFLAILLEKVLPRIQGEAKQLETNDGKSNILKDLIKFVETNFKPDTSLPESAQNDGPSLYDQVIRKLNEMNGKLSGYYTNFF